MENKYKNSGKIIPLIDVNVVDHYYLWGMVKVYLIIIFYVIFVGELKEINH